VLKPPAVRLREAQQRVDDVAVELGLLRMLLYGARRRWRLLLAALVAGAAATLLSPTVVARLAGGVAAARSAVETAGAPLVAPLAPLAASARLHIGGLLRG
jgi:hypothetical protein